ncbi:MAG TPA: hypothetical protein VGM98_05355 [Schlesneria sp.]
MISVIDGNGKAVISIFRMTVDTDALQIWRRRGGFGTVLRFREALQCRPPRRVSSKESKQWLIKTFRLNPADDTIAM